MNDYYLLYYKPLKMFLRTHEGRFEHTMKEITEVCDEYAKDKDKCPNGCVADILICINAKDILFNTKLHEEDDGCEVDALTYVDNKDVITRRGKYGKAQRENAE